MTTQHEHEKRAADRRPCTSCRYSSLPDSACAKAIERLNIVKIERELFRFEMEKLMATQPLAYYSPTSNSVSLCREDFPADATIWPLVIQTANTAAFSTYDILDIPQPQPQPQPQPLHLPGEDPTS